MTGYVGLYHSRTHQMQQPQHSSLLWHLKFTWKFTKPACLEPEYWRTVCIAATNRPCNCLLMSMLFTMSPATNDAAIIPHASSFASHPFTHCKYPSPPLIFMTCCS